MSTLLLIWALQTVALAMPGPNTFIISFLAVSEKSSAAYYAALGICTGASLWCISALLGLNTLFELLPQIRLTIQILGACYLIYLASSIWKSNDQVPDQNQLALSSFKAYLKGLLVNLSNPKSALFFGSIFSATLPSNPDNALIVSAVLLLTINSLCWHLMLARVLSSNKIKIKYLQFRSFINKVSSLIFAGLGGSIFFKSIQEID